MYGRGREERWSRRVLSFEGALVMVCLRGVGVGRIGAKERQEDAARGLQHTHTHAPRPK